MRRRAIVTFVGMLATVIAFAAPAFGAEDTDTAVEAGSTVSLTVEVVDAALLIPAVQKVREAASAEVAASAEGSGRGDDLLFGGFSLEYDTNVDIRNGTVANFDAGVAIS